MTDISDWQEYIHELEQQRDALLEGLMKACAYLPIGSDQYNAARQLIAEIEKST